MPQAVWVGHLSFGLVNIPVKLYGATSPKSVRFHQYEAGSGRRIRYRRVAEGRIHDHIPSAPDEEPEPLRPVDAAERSSAAPGSEARREAAGQVDVPWEQIVKGFEVEPGRVVTVDPEELESIAPENSRVLEVEQFVDLADIDPVHFDRSYYVLPQSGVEAERPYWLLYRAMEAAAKVAVGRFVMRTREHLAAVRPAEHVLMLHTLFYADEVRDPKDLWLTRVDEPPEEELRVAHLFLDALAATWEPARHRDEYRERLLDLLHSKIDEALALPEPDEKTSPPPVVDLMKALEASVEAAKQARRDERRGTG
jgi:DNA end-binding protein Ku